MMDVAETSLRQVVGSKPIDDVLTTEKEAVQPAVQPSVQPSVQPAVQPAVQLAVQPAVHLKKNYVEVLGTARSHAGNPI